MFVRVYKNISLSEVEMINLSGMVWNNEEDLGLARLDYLNRRTLKMAFIQ